MVYMYTGTPGSGKSYHAAKVVYDKLRRRKNVISTMPIDLNVVNNKGRKRIGKYEFIFMHELTPKYLIEFANKHHKRGKESQTTLVMDECQVLFNPRSYGDTGRKEWILFFSVHRHYGFDVMLITQMDRFIDRQIRGLAEVEYVHRKLNNRGLLNLLPIKIFVVVEYWYAAKPKARIGAHFVRYKRSISRIYNSYETNEKIAEILGVKPEKKEEAIQEALPVFNSYDSDEMIAEILGIETENNELEAPPLADPALSGGGGRGAPPSRWAGRAREWFTKGLREADVKY